MSNKFLKPLRFSCCVVVVLSLYMLQGSVAYSVDDISVLEDQGRAALAKNDFPQMLAIGKEILARDSQNMEGYKLVLLYSFRTKLLSRAMGDVEQAIKQGGPAIRLRQLEAHILYLLKYPQFSIEVLSDCEKIWQEENDKRR